MKRFKAILAISAFTLVTFLSCEFLGGDITQAEANKRIEQWYAEQGDQYNLDLSDKKVDLKVTRYHPERPEEKDDMITAEYEGMTITIMFGKPLADIPRTEAAFKENFWYVSLDDIYSDISVPGWDVNPRTPQSSKSEPSCIEFTKVTDTELAFEINWEIYTVFGYGTNDFCQDALGIADSSMPDECMAGVEKRIPIKVTVDGKF